jgi:hypothetical protein
MGIRWAKDERVVWEVYEHIEEEMYRALNKIGMCNRRLCRAKAGSSLPVYIVGYCKIAARHRRTGIASPHRSLYWKMYSLAHSALLIYSLCRCARSHDSSFNGHWSGGYRKGDPNACFLNAS